MKKYLVFLAIFIVLYLVIQIAMGAILTAFYTPDVSSTKNGVVLKLAPHVPTAAIFLAALIAYFLSQKLSKASKVRTQ